LATIHASFSMCVLISFCTHEIDSTPPAAKMSPSPAITRCAAIAIVCSPDEQKRFTVIPDVVTGQPPRSAIWRAMLRPVAPSGFAHPMITSSTSAGSIRARAIACCSAWPPMVAPCVMLNAPFQLLPQRRARGGDDDGIRHAVTLTAFARFGIHSRDHGPRARRPRRAGSVPRPGRPVRIDDARRLRRRDHQDRAARRRDRPRLGTALLRRRVGVLRQLEPQQEERRDRPEASRRQGDLLQAARWRRCGARESPGRYRRQARHRLRARARAAAADHLLLHLRVRPGRSVPQPRGVRFSSSRPRAG